MMCLSDRFTSTGALSDCSTFTSTDARATDLRHCFFWRTSCRLGACVFARAQALSPYLFIHQLNLYNYLHIFSFS